MSKQTKPKTKRVCPKISFSAYGRLKQAAVDNKRSVSQQAALLMEAALLHEVAK